MKKFFFWIGLAGIVAVACGATLLAYGWTIGRKLIPLTEFHGQVIQPDPVLGFAAIPNATGRRRDPGGDTDYYIYTNGLSARVNKPGEPTPSHVDVMTLGGSTSQGHGLPNENTYTSIIGERLHVPVANFANGGYGTVASLLILERWQQLRPKLVIYEFTDEQIRRNVQPCAPSFTPVCIAEPYVVFDANHSPSIFPLQPEDLVGMRLNIAALSTAGTLRPLKTALLGLEIAWYRNRGRSAPSNYTVDEEHDPDRAFQFAMARMKAVTDRMGAKLLVTYFPAMNLNDARPFAKPALLPEGITFVDMTGPLTDAMRAAKTWNLYVTPGDPHPSAKAFTIIAGELLNAIDQEHLL